MESSEGGAGRESRLVLGGDGFLLAAALDVVVIALFFAAVSAIFPGDAPMWMQAGSGIMTIVLALAGPLIVWRLHRRRFEVLAIVGMVVGAGVGGTLAVGLFIGFGMLPRLFGVSSDEGPWGGVAALAIVALVFAIASLAEAVRDLRRNPPRARGLDWLRIAAFVAIVATTGVFAYIGAVQQSEAGEVGIFGALFGLASAFAVIGADILSPAPPAPAAPVQPPAGA